MRQTTASARDWLEKGAPRHLNSFLAADQWRLVHRKKLYVRLDDIQTLVAPWDTEKQNNERLMTITRAVYRYR